MSVVQNLFLSLLTVFKSVLDKIDLLLLLSQLDKTCRLFFLVSSSWSGFGLFYFLIRADFIKC